MAFRSYAQNFEDVVLARAFAGRTDGFYVDVGAGHPIYDSVTKHFYDLGWRGVNIEPLAEECELLRKERPDDIVVEAALSDQPGELTIYVGPPENRGSTTLDRTLADRYRQEGQEFDQRTVSVTTLEAVLTEHVAGDIDFLKVDVEGHEARVLAGVDLSRWRPRVLLIEATYPNSTKRSDRAWEESVLGAGYRFALWDGLNRFYVRQEDAGLSEVLSAPANVLDGFVPERFQREIDGLREHLDLTTQALEEAGSSYGKLGDARADAERYARSLEERVRELEVELHGAQDEAAWLEDELARLDRAAEAARRVSAEESVRRADAEQARQDLDRAVEELAEQLRVCERERAELAKLLTTRIFRYTAVPRRVYGWIRNTLDGMGRR